MKYLLRILAFLRHFAGMNQVHIVLVEIYGMCYELLQGRVAFSAAKLAIGIFLENS